MIDIVLAPEEKMRAPARTMTDRRTMKTTSMMLGTIGLAIVAFASPARSEGEHTATAPDGIKWGDAPPVFNKGAKFAVLYGDPSKPGLFIVRLKLPANF